MILERAPDLGRTDTGPGVVVRYDVVGKGKAHVIYNEPYVNKSTEVDVPLPWFVEFTVPDIGPSPDPLHVAANFDVSATPVPLRCSITFNGTVTDQQNALNLETCLDQYTAGK